MIVLKDTEKLVREDRVELSGDDGRKYGNGTLYLTNTRLMFETENGVVPRLIVLYTIQSVVPVKKHEFTVSYMNDDGTKIFTDRYKMREGGNCEDWIADFRNTSNVSISSGVELAYSKSTTEGRANGIESSQDDRQNVNDVVVDVNAKTLSWKKVEGWRKFSEEHIWQGRDRMEEMTKQEWLVYKKEAFILHDKIDNLYDEYFEAKKAKDKQRCRKIKEEMRIVDKELYGKGNIPFTNIAADKWPDS